MWHETKKQTKNSSKGKDVRCLVPTFVVAITVRPFWQKRFKLIWTFQETAVQIVIFS